MNTELQTRQVLIVEDKESAASETIASAIDRLIQALEDKDISVQIAESYCEAFPVVETNMDIDCFLVASDMDYDKASESRAAKLLKQIKERQAKAPVFLLADRAKTSQKMSAELMEQATEFAWIFEDSPQFIAGRIEGAIRRYRDNLLPPPHEGDLGIQRTES